ncbi:hypothetical protein C8R46DRAFT_672071 [Mycena filopes]|nr:hypothetical protein C8R46DRAFT_672071 [Mycena filopes]
MHNTKTKMRTEARICWMRFEDTQKGLWKKLDWTRRSWVAYLASRRVLFSRRQAAIRKQHTRRRAPRRQLRARRLCLVLRPPATPAPTLRSRPLQHARPWVAPRPCPAAPPRGYPRLPAPPIHKSTVPFPTDTTHTSKNISEDEDEVDAFGDEGAEGEGVEESTPGDWTRRRLLKCLLVLCDLVGPTFGVPSASAPASTTQRDQYTRGRCVGGSRVASVGAVPPRPRRASAPSWFSMSAPVDRRCARVWG